MATNVNYLDKAPDVVFKTLGKVLAAYEDPTGLARPLWRDMSRYQPNYNFGVAAANGVFGYAARMGISWGYVDPEFQYFWGAGKGVVKYRTSYHVIYSDQPVVRQADNWYNAMPEIDVIPRVIDLEVDRGVSNTQVADAVWAMSELVKSRDGVRPIIYSRKLLIDRWLASWTDAMLNDHYYWLAQYLWDRVREHPGPPTLPNRVLESRVVLHQTADKKAPFSGETTANTIDYNRWEIGDSSAMHAWINNTWGPGTPPPPPPPPPDPEPGDLQAQVDALNSRVSVLEGFHGIE